jgi:hypothetical protein
MDVPPVGLIGADFTLELAQSNGMKYVSVVRKLKQGTPNCH